jgi:predicted ATPase/class 3 adenylate cyclase
MRDDTAIAWPTGTVTFVVTDLERSTSLYEAHGSTYESLLDEHRALCRTSFDAHGGVEVSCPGDGFLVAFASPSAAVAAAVDLQRRNTAVAWPEGAELRTRIGIHTGEATITSTGGTYAGLSVHEAARVGAAGHGGQVLLSESTFRLVEHRLPDGVTGRSLGAHRLAGLDGPRTLLELRGAGLRSGFPPLRTQTARPGNLPRRRPGLIGRDEEARSLAALVPERSLTTLVGPGGIGKTSLALEVARTLEADFGDGAWFVDLAAAPVAGPVTELVSRVGSALDVDVTGDARALAGAFGARQALIVLDSCEHVLQDVAEIAETMLEAAPGVRLLATSRERLGIPGERVVRLDALSVPAATELFRVRASDVSVGFEVTASMRSDIERICARLDHLPLAIELAARRVNVLSPVEILARLDQRFALLTDGGRRTTDRHRTLEATVDWSFSLLSERERRMLARLSVFAGGCTLEAAQFVCGGDPLADREVLDLVASLVDRSLVHVDRDDAGVRYRLLETVRAYAADRLEASGEAEQLRARHLRWYADLSWGALDLVTSGGGSVDLPELAREGDNMRAAVGWAQHSGDLDLGLRVASGVAIYAFETGGHFRVSRTWVDELLAAGAAATDPALRVQALYCAANVAAATDDDDVLTRYGEEMLILADRHDLPAEHRGSALVVLGLSHREDGPRRLAEMQEGAALQEAGGALGFLSFTQSMISQLALESGDLETALISAEKALQTGRRIGLDVAVARALIRLAHVAEALGELDVAAARATEGVAVARSAGAGTETGLALIAQAVVAAATGDRPRARALFVEAAEQFTQLGFAGLPVRIYCAIATQQIREADRPATSWAIDQLEEALVAPPADPASRRALAGLIAAAEEAGMEELVAGVRDRLPLGSAG